MNIKKSIVLRVRIAFLLIFLFSLSIVTRIGYVQFYEGDKWRAIAEENLLQYRTVKATRGNIYSDNGSLLATSLPFYKVAFDPMIADNSLYNSAIDSLCILLSSHFGDRSWVDYKRKINDARKSKKQYLIINRQMINYHEKKKMEKWPLFREGRLGGGVIFEKVDKRFRPFNYLAKRTIGFTNEDQKGAGLEYSFNNYLAGENGEALFRKIAGGNWKPVHDQTEITPRQGYDIQTTIDINLQDVAESSLHKHLVRHEADYGSLVLMEVATGEIKAIANLSRLKSGQYAEIYNYAVGGQGLIEPGSTFKLASMISLFEDSHLTPQDTVETGEGQYEFYDKVMTDSKPTGYGDITLQEAFEVSSNIGISRLIHEQFAHDPEKFMDYLRKMGLTERLGFQLIGEAVPYFKDPSDNNWSGITLPWMSIGYELKLSPLQILSLYNAVANDGKMVRPMIVKGIKKADRTVEKYRTKVIKDKICSGKTLQYVQGMLEGVVERGTARNIRSDQYKIAGKTGTTQKIRNGRYIKNYYASFVGYFPADKPKYSCIVVIDNPKGDEMYGSQVAAPVFREVADKVFSQDLEMHKPVIAGEVKGPENIFPVIRSGHIEDLRTICNRISITNHSTSGADEWVNTSVYDNAIYWKSKKIVNEKVPDVTGMTLRDAIYLLENAGLRVSYQGVGRIQEQSIAPGSTFSKGDKIRLRLQR